MPAMIFISVDLPAPFSPIKAWTCPRLRRNCTSSSASTPGKALRTCSTSSKYSAPGIAPLSRTISAVVGLRLPIARLPAPVSASVAGRNSHTTCTRPGTSAPGRYQTSVLFDELVNVVRSDELERNIDLLVDRLSRRERERRVDRALALTGGVLEHSDFQIARLHRG